MEAIARLLARGYGAEETAELLNIPPGTVRGDIKRLQRAYTERAVTAYAARQEEHIFRELDFYRTCLEREAEALKAFEESKAAPLKRKRSRHEPVSAGGDGQPTGMRITGGETDDRTNTAGDYRFLKEANKARELAGKSLGRLGTMLGFNLRTDDPDEDPQVPPPGQTPPGPLVTVNAITLPLPEAQLRALGRLVAKSEAVDVEAKEAS